MTIALPASDVRAPFRLLGILPSGDPFSQEGPRVTRLISLASDLKLRDWRIEGTTDEGPRVVLEE